MSRSLLALLALAGSLHAEVLFVPSVHSTIQSAIDAAQPGDEVQVAGGLYAEALQVQGKSGLVLRGVGNVRVDAPADEPSLTLSACDAVSVKHLRFRGGVGPVVLLDGCEDVLVSDCRIEPSGGEAEAGSLEVFDSAGVRVEFCRFVRCAGDGAVQAGLLGPSVDDLSVRRCLFDKPAADALRLGLVVGSEFRENVVRSPGHGLCTALEGLSEVVFRRNRVVAAGGTVLYAFGSDIAVDGNIFTHALGDGPYVSGARVSMTGNRVLSAVGQGLTVFGDDAVLSDNTISHCSQLALVVIGDHAMVAGNTALLPYDGLLVVGADSDVLHNALTRPQIGGVMAHGAAGVIEGNVVREPTEGSGFVLSGAALSISANRVVEAGWCGFEIYADAAVFSGNVSRGAAEDGLFLSGSGSMLSGNVASGSGHLDLNEESPGANTLGPGNKFGTSNAP